MGERVNLFCIEEAGIFVVVAVINLFRVLVFLDNLLNVGILIILGKGGDDHFMETNEPYKTRKNQ